MSKEKRVLKEIAGLKLSKEALAAAETLLASKDGSAALTEVLGAAILTTAAKFKAPAPAGPAQTQAASKDAAQVKKDKKKDKKEKKAAKKEKKDKDKKDKKDKKSKDKKTKDKAKDILQSKGAALPKPEGAKPIPAAPASSSPSA